MTHAGFIQLFLNRHLFQNSTVEKETNIFYLASIITFSVFSDLLCKYTYLYVTRKMDTNLPQVNQFDVCILLVRRLRQVHTVKLNGILWLVVKTYLLAVPQCHN